MKRWSVLAGVALLGVVSVVGFQTGDAWGRAGGGGSRGSRSYSPPARPSPVIPSTPSPSPAPSRPAAPMSQPAPSRPGWGGGLLGGLGGFLVGGLLGSLLFGGLGHGAGIGLLDLLLVAGGVVLLMSWLRRRQASGTPAYAGMPSRYGDAGSWPAGSGGTATAAPPATEPSAAERPAAVVDLERGVAHIRQMDPGFNPADVESLARDVFAEVQRALGARDLAVLRGRLAPEMAAVLQQQCDELRGSRRVNHVESIDVRQATVTEAWQETGRDYVTVYLAGSLVDYTVDENSGAVVAGSRSSQAFEEYWTFARSVGPNVWALTAIQTA
jgi:predicted lipid-binding transport protein (Tim44 family)